MLLVAVLIAALLPVSMVLTLSEKGPDDRKNEAIMESLEQYRAYQREAVEIAVDPLIDIEKAWEIEDTRQEAENALIMAMHNHGAPLGFDSGEMTFYCPIVMTEEDNWPEIQMTALCDSAEPVHIAWIDDYTYDYPSEALRDGYRYELLAYTDTCYAYVGVVFTGMPIISLHIGYDGELGESYVPARFGVADPKRGAIHGAALTHLRGGGVYKGIDKFSYRVELHDERLEVKGDKCEVSVLGMEPSTDWLLLSNAQEETAIRNYLAYDLWNRWNANKPAPMMIESRLAEVFVDDRYMGIYQIMPAVDEKAEIERMGGNLQTDSVVRMVIESNRHERPNKSYFSDSGFFVECRYAPYRDPMRVFDDFENYARLSIHNDKRLNDEAFAQLAEQCIDVENMISYYLFMQACGLGDNVFNNLYIWNIQEDGHFVHRVSPWDMDLSLQETGYQEDGSVYPYYEDRMVLPTRLLDLNVAGARKILWKLWNEKRSTVLMDSELEKWIITVQDYVNASGAYKRESGKWRAGAYELNCSPMLNYEIEHMWTIESTMMERWPLDIE